ncbi:DUF1788 domain-containing protein [Bradyrhizobium barranii subsp. apii]|uniref:BREX protein BrxB domain-containing protein n=1 Tax=Bradyrhizobium barranii TaxID=2992140 RepID=UPI00205F40BA|nr:BREX protein BrxB domain-containing protein [Bradyrhizobium barranii]UPU00962.1 DUF1788 domain-containing protein [Bradyrhizobium barranii subsp. apii]
MTSQRPLEDWYEAERSGTVEETVQTITNILEEYAPLVDLVAARMPTDPVPTKDVVLISRTGALFPVYRTFSLLEQLKGRVHVPTIAVGLRDRRLDRCGNQAEVDHQLADSPDRLPRDLPVHPEAALARTHQGTGLFEFLRSNEVETCSDDGGLLKPEGIDRAERRAANRRRRQAEFALDLIGCLDIGGRIAFAETLGDFSDRLLVVVGLGFGHVLDSCRRLPLQHRFRLQVGPKLVGQHIPEGDLTCPSQRRIRRQGETNPRESGVSKFSEGSLRLDVGVERWAAEPIREDRDGVRAAEHALQQRRPLASASLVLRHASQVGIAQHVRLQHLVDGNIGEPLSEDEPSELLKRRLLIESAGLL